MALSMQTKFNKYWGITTKALICAQNWIQSKPLDDMTEEIDGAEEIDEEFINIGKEMEAAFENLNNDSMSLEAQ
uniref:Zinc finger BED domain-containing protein RICESLEEPER 2-like n=1 Tax=Cucumis melo TaxID=3656 RepID=A0A9I9EA00_CUCME